MNRSLLAIVKKIITDHGINILNDPKRLQPFVSDYASAEPKEDRVAFGRAIEQGFYQELKRASPDDFAQKKQAMVLRLQNITGYDARRCQGAIDLIEALIPDKTATNYYSSPRTNTGYTVSLQPQLNQTKKRSAVPFVIIAAVIIIIIILAMDNYGGGGFIDTATSVFSTPSWQGYSTYESFAKAIDMDEFLGYPVDENRFASLIALIIYSSFEEENIDFDIVSGPKLTERYGVTETQRQNYKYLAKDSNGKGTPAYWAYFNGENWTVLIFTE